jgi:dUTP pyrophosphatase
MDDILFEALHADVTPPVRATAHSAGYDLRAWFARDHIDVWSGAAVSTRPLGGSPGTYVLTLGERERAVVPLGFRATLPPGIEGQIRARSGLALKKGLIVPNAPGTIDPDYTGEWGVLVMNASTEPLTITHGERIAQLILTRFVSLGFTAGTVVPTTERAGGFGSTGAH